MKSLSKQSLVTIGIPAYNEEGNIAHLLTDLLAQVQPGFRIKAIIVASDGSRDATVAKAKSVSSSLVKVISAKREGKAARVLQLLSLARGTTAVILDADTRLTDKHFISKLVTPVITGSADITSASQAEIAPEGLLERSLFSSMRVLNRAYSEYRQGNNFFTCHGQARAFSPRLGKSLRLPFSSGEDLYTYLFCRQKGFTYQYVPDAVTHYRLPTRLKDHIRQSSRFVQSLNRIKEHFPCRLTEYELRLPLWQISKNAVVELFRYPIFMTIYIAVFIYSRIIANVGNYFKDAWDTSPSSKSLGIV